MQGLLDLFKEHYIELPDDKIDAAELLSNKVAELEEQLETVINSNVELTNKVEEFEKEAVVMDKLDGLTQVQVDKFIKLAESINFDGDVDEYSKKLDIIKESNFSNKADKKTNLITEEDFTQDDDDAEQVIHDPAMKAYVAATKRTVKKF
jgi:hypothetical protein